MKAASPKRTHIHFDNSYAKLPDRFYTRLNPVPVTNPELIRVNHALAEMLNIDPAWLESEEGVAVAAGNIIPEGADPIATVYAGHQFGGWSPQLGDGRAILLGEVVNEQGERFDVQLKGSGQTPYSRRGDGRAPLGPVLREYIVSEAMTAFGLPTSRTLAAVSTGDPVFRETTLPGAVLVRIARSHVRIGTFQFFASQGDEDALRILAEHVIERHYPQAASDKNPILSMLKSVIENQAHLIAGWQALGFIHGVMNTDNMLLSGETIDYGPCAFMDAFNPLAVYSYIDQHGRYAYGNQPAIGQWNLTRLAEALLPLLNENRNRAIELATEALDGYPDFYANAYRKQMNSKLGLNDFMEGDEQLLDDLLTIMAEEKLDYTLTFRRLSDLAESVESSGRVGELITFPEWMNGWLERWRVRLDNEESDPSKRQLSMHSLNPVFIPRNHLVEEVIEAAVERGDFQLFHQLADLLERPYEYHSANRRYATPPTPDQVVKQTFCGT